MVKLPETIRKPSYTDNVDSSWSLLWAGVVITLVVVLATFAAAQQSVPPARDDDYLEFSTGNRKYIVREAAINMISFPIDRKGKHDRTVVVVGATRIETDWTEADFQRIRGAINGKGNSR